VSSLKRPKVWIAFLAIVLFFLAYSPALDGPFVFDDQRQITDNPVVSHGVGLGETSFWTNINERPLTAFTLFLNHRISGADPFWFRITNMLLHILNAFMVFLIVKELFLLDGKKEKVDLAFGIGLLFLLHPLLSENFLYISQRGSTLSSFFYLGALFFYLRSKSTSIMRLLLSVLLFALALYSKQTAFSLIMVVALLELFVLPDSSNSRRAFVVTILTLGGLVLLYKYGGCSSRALRSSRQFKFETCFCSYHLNARRSCASLQVWRFYGQNLCRCERHRLPASPNLFYVEIPSAEHCSLPPHSRL